MKKSLVFLILFGVSMVGFSQNLAKDTTEVKSTIADFFELFVQDDMKFFEKNLKGILPYEIAIDTKRDNGVKDYETLQKINKL